MPAPAATVALSAAAVPPDVAGLASRIEAVPESITRVPLVRHAMEAMPAADLLFGGAMLVVIILMHATALHHVTAHVARRCAAIMRQPTRWRASVLVCSAVFALLSLHVLEILVWTAALVHAGLLADWRSAGFFAASAFTTVGFGSDILPDRWRMLGPIIAMSGLFTFGWSGSMLVDFVGRAQKITDVAAG